MRPNGIGALVRADPENLRRTERKAAAMEIGVCPEFVLSKCKRGRGVPSLGTLAGKESRLPTVDTMKSTFKNVWRLKGQENKTKPWHSCPHTRALVPLGSV